MKNYEYDLLLMGVSMSYVRGITIDKLEGCKSKALKICKALEESNYVVSVNFPLDLLVTVALIYNNSKKYAVKFVSPTLENFVYNQRRHLFIFPEADITDLNSILPRIASLSMKGYKFLFNVITGLDKVPTYIKARAEILGYSEDNHE